MKPLIKVGGFEFSNYVTKCFEHYPENCTDPGIFITVLYNQLLSCGFRIQFNDVKNYTNGFKMLENGDLDLITSVDNLKTASLLSDFDITSPMFEDHSVFVLDDSKTKKLTPNLLLYMCPWSVWLLVSVTLISVLLYKYLHRAIAKWLRLKEHTGKNFSEQLPLILWSLAFGIFCEFFQNNLSITLASTISPSIPFSNTETFLNSLTTHRCEIFLLRKQEDYWEVFFQTEGPLFEGFRRMMENKRVKIIENETEGIQTIRESDCNVALATSTDFILLEAEYGKLKMVRLHELPINQYVLHFRKNSKYKKQFGLINTFGSTDDQYYREVSKTAEKLRQMNPQRETSDKKRFTSLTMSHLYSGFMILFFGLVISSITLFYDLMCNYLYAFLIKRHIR